MGVLIFVYTQVEPFLLFALRRRIPDGETIPATEETVDSEEALAKPEETNDPLSVLAKREREVAELICLGYSNRDIAKMLFISEHTVKDYTKKIYPKLDVHSRMELAALVNRYQTK